MSERRPVDSFDQLEVAAEKIESLLSDGYGMSRRAVALLVLQEDDEILALVKARESGKSARIAEIVESAKKNFGEPLAYIISVRRQELAARIADSAVEGGEKDRIGLGERLSRLMISPATGIPILALILYFGVYMLVGKLGAGVLVDLVETHVFQGHVTPWLLELGERFVPWPLLRDLFTGEFGILTLGLRYAVAIILPIAAMFFLVFSVIEDSGYLPRLALLIDGLFKRLGLSGRAVIPMVIGLGCSTMATLVTRTLPTKRERLIATILLALAVPCSAQLGVVLSLLEGTAAGLVIWGGAVSAVFVAVGWLSSKLLPGEAPSFYMEIPPLRMPKVSNVLIKTFSRAKWYFFEIVPVFVYASAIMWAFQAAGLFKLAVRLVAYPVAWMGLPDESSVAFIFGFFRRDYGAAGLYDIKKAGHLTDGQLVIACVVLTLFIPCIAQFMINIKERGLKTALAISAFVLLIAFAAGLTLNLVFKFFGVML